MSASKKITRREFIKGAAGVAGLFALGGLPLRSFTNPGKITRNMPATTAGVEKARAWCMVIDMKRCDGCVTLDVPPQCTQACIAGHFVPKGQEWIKIYTQQLPGGGTYFQPTPCYQCENAPCVNVCPVAATYQDKTGVVLIDHDRCIGCRMCMAACPYQRRFFNWGTPQIPAEAFAEEYSPLNEGPAVKGTVIKCSF